MNIRFGPVRKLPGSVTQMSAVVEGGGVYQINQHMREDDPCSYMREEDMFVQLMLQVYNKEIAP